MPEELTRRAPLQLEVFQLSNCLLQENLNGSTNDISVDLDFDIVREEKGKLLGLSVKLAVNPQESQAVLSGSIQALGLFAFHDSDNVDEYMNRLVGNGLVIVYGMLRGIVYEKASSLPPNLRILPTLDLVELVKRKVEEHVISSAGLRPESDHQGP